MIDTKKINKSLKTINNNEINSKKKIRKRKSITKNNDQYFLEDNDDNTEK
jgi:hypothetical protein